MAGGCGYPHLVSNEGDPGVIEVEPGGNLAVGDDEDVSDPGGVAEHRPQRVSHLLIVLEPAGRDVVPHFLCHVGHLQREGGREGEGGLNYRCWGSLESWWGERKASI